MFHNHKLCYMNSRMVQIFFGSGGGWGAVTGVTSKETKKKKKEEKLKEFIYPWTYLLSLSTSF